MYVLIQDVGFDESRSFIDAGDMIDSSTLEASKDAFRKNDSLNYLSAAD